MGQHGGGANVAVLKSVVTQASAAIPVMRRGNNLLGTVGPGAGTLVAYGVALLERTVARAGRPGAIVLTATSEAATALAESLGRIALSTSHSLGALGGAWGRAWIGVVHIERAFCSRPLAARGWFRAW